jgi:hypothetical protein
MAADAHTPDPQVPDLFSTRTPRVKPASTATPSQGTADRGVGAAAGHVARQAVRADAVKHASADPDDPWVQRQRSHSKRAQNEHLAEGSGHDSLFEYTPGTQLIAPKALDPYLAFWNAWYDARTKAEETYDGVTHRTFQFFAQARGVVFGANPVQTLDPNAHGARLASVVIGGYRFAADGATDLDTFNRLAGRVKKGREAAVGPADDPSLKRAPSALEVAWSKLSPEMRAQKESYAYFHQRITLFTRSRDRGLAFELTPHDMKMAAQVGVAVPSDEAGIAALDPVAFFQATRDGTRAAEWDAWEGLEKNSSLPGEGTALADQRVGSIEGVRTSRYIDDGASKATAAHAATKQSERDARGPTL